MSINSISGLLGNALLNELNTANLQIGKAFERLATGQRINSASDDAAGLAIASRMEAEQRGLAMAERNAQMGISMAQTAEGYLGSVTEDVQRMRELAVQASNGTLSSEDRQAIQEEINSLRENIDTTLSSAEFNGQKLFTGETRTLQIGADASGTMSFTIPSMSSESLGLSEVDVTTQAGAEAAIAAGDTALSEVLSARTDLGATQNRLESSIKSLSQTRNDTLSALSGIRDANMAEEALNASRATNRLESLLLLASQVNKLNREMLPPLLQ